MNRSARLPEIVVIGSASRDVVDDDPRGWRLGGGVTYSALATGRLGLRTAALIGVDREAAAAGELDLLRDAGVDVHLVHLDRAPVFINRELPGGRLQECIEPGQPLQVEALPDAWRSVPAWIMSSVAGEIDDPWAALPPADAFVVVGWQGLLRVLAAGRTVARRPPSPSPLLTRADLVGVSETDVSAGLPLGALTALLRPGARLVVTRGGAGGHLLGVGADHEPTELGSYSATPASGDVDPTGAGDTFLAALASSALAGSLDLDFAAAAGSLVVEGPGLIAVPDRAAVLERMAATGTAADRPSRTRAERQRPSASGRPPAADR
jgi:sugar/nucleoside kinase (ribokinase family)